MRLGARIGLFVAVVAVVPPLMVASIVADVAERAVSDAVLRSEVSAAQDIASAVARQLEDAERLLGLQIANFRLDVAPDEAREAFAIATYRLLPEIAIAALVDAAGTELVTPVYQSVGAAAALPDHDPIDAPRLTRFRAQLPEPGAAGDVTVGTAYVPAGASAAVVPIVATSPYGDGVALAVELSLSSVAARLAGAESEARAVLVFDRDGTPLVRSGPDGWADAARLRPFLAAPSADVRYTTDAGVEVLAATAQVPGRAWTVVVAEPATSVLRATQAVQARAAYIAGVAVMFALVAGRLFAGGLTGPILRVRDAAVAVGQGDYSRRLVAAGEAEAVGGELAELVAAFDKMSESLARSRRELDEKNAEIAAFAQELQVRVERRTAQLREAQARLVQSGQLAAVAQLSAGVAHELNNPLAGALGAVQVARARLAGRPEADLLEAAEREALRCREIVARLLRFTESSRDEVTDEQADLARVLADVLALSATALRERSITAALATPSAPILLRADPRALGRAFGQLVAALRGVAAPGATLRVDLCTDGDEARVRFVLDGTTSGDDDWRAAGLAFWVARQVFDTHGATLEEPADTAEGVGAGGPRTWSLRVPRATASA